MPSLHSLRFDIARAGTPIENILTPVVLCGLLTSSAMVPAATLTGRFAYCPSSVTVNLSEEGTLDWGHWGLWNEWTYNHKYGVAQQIRYSFITVEGYPGWPGPYLIPYGER